ncbi:FecCD family ABC transporter permease [Magnetospirillum sulfuroxidans]|uniref:Iron ABC transporter permease n=1 Tax=Magnetospirillum sulfuroxidans TaxID=611300 RepID=A0ABS5IHA0_9PROT|nr:iron ABC transporter permease [Magnetospirillum sulfuroxidans]MBR9973772.1 iron ABC transporter permease [Magnetospirillum sulfuroxidans]
MSPRWYFLLLGGLAVLALGSLLIGSVSLAPAEVMAALFGQGESKMVLVVQELRLPRALLGLIVGAALGIAGAALQGLLRNPLAEPALIGTSACAGLGGVIAFYFGWAAAFAWALPLAAIVMAGLGTLLLLTITGTRAGTLTIILAGVVISSLAISFTSLAMNLSSNPFAVNEIILWLMGSLKDRSFQDVQLAAPFVLVGALVLLRCGPALDALTLGDEAAASLGFSMARLNLTIILGCALAVGASVAVAGSIGFVGLVVPHVLRPLARNRPSALLLPSAIGGALLVTAADVAVRLIPSTSEIMLGVLTSIVGGPFFLSLLLKIRKSHS